MSLRPLLICLLCAVFFLQGCAQYENKRGVEIVWQKEATAGLVRGESRREDVLRLLGPPSQVIALDGETAMYYLFEHSDGDGLILILYNRMHITTRYDRAIFFFDENNVLTEFSTFIHHDHENDEECSKCEL